MKPILIVLIPAILGAAELPRLQQLFDPKLPATERANICFELRGNSSAEVISRDGAGDGQSNAAFLRRR